MFLGLGLRNAASGLGPLAAYVADGEYPSFVYDPQAGTFYADNALQSRDSVETLTASTPQPTYDSNGNLVWAAHTSVGKTDFSSGWTPTNVTPTVTDGVARLEATAGNARYEQLSIAVVDDVEYQQRVQARLISGNGEVNFSLSGLGATVFNLTSEWQDLDITYIATSTSTFRWRIQITNSGDIIEIRFPDHGRNDLAGRQNPPVGYRTAGAPDWFLANTGTGALYLPALEHHGFDAYSTSNEAPASALTDVMVNGDFSGTPSLMGVSLTGFQSTSTIDTDGYQGESSVLEVQGTVAGGTSNVRFAMTDELSGQLLRVSYRLWVPTGWTAVLIEQTVDGVQDTLETITERDEWVDVAYYVTPIGTSNRPFYITAGAPNPIDEPLRVANLKVEVVGALGEELSVGDLDSTDGWTTSNATVSAITGGLRVTSGGSLGNVGIYRPVTFELGKTYLVHSRLLADSVYTESYRVGEDALQQQGFTTNYNGTVDTYIVYTHGDSAVDTASMLFYDNSGDTGKYADFAYHSVKEIGLAGAWTKKGTLIEPGRTTSVTGGYSQPTAATLTSVNLTETDDAGYGLKGAGTCLRVTGSGVAGTHRFEVGATSNSAARTAFILIPKSSTQQYGQFVHAGDTNRYANFNLQTGAVTAEGSSWTDAGAVRDLGLFWMIGATDDGTSSTSNFFFYFIDSATTTWASPSSSTDYLDIAQMGVVDLTTLPVTAVPTYGSDVTTARPTVDLEATTLPDPDGGYVVVADVVQDYVDSGTNNEARYFVIGSGQYMQGRLRTDSTRTGAAYVLTNNGIGTYGQDTNGAVTDLSPGIDVAAKLGFRVTSDEVNAALNGTAAVASGAITQLPNVLGDGTTDLELATVGQMTMRKLLIYTGDAATDAVMEAATA